MRSNFTTSTVFGQHAEIASQLLSPGAGVPALDLTTVSFPASSDKSFRFQVKEPSNKQHLYREQLHIVREAFTDALLHSKEYQQWVKKYATVDRAVDALRRADAESFELVAYNLQGVERTNAQLGFTLSRVVGRTVKGMLRAAKEADDRELLAKVSKITLSAIQNDIHYEVDTKNPITTQTLIVEMHKKGLYRQSAQIVEAALKSNFVLKPETILSTLSLCGKSIARPGHVALYAQLAKTALQSGLLDPEDSRVTRVFDVVLAQLGSPEVLNNPTRDRFAGEKGLIEVSDRLRKATEVALLVVESGLRFETERDEARMNMLIRGALTGAMGITAQCLKLVSPGERQYHSAVDKYYELDVQYPWFNSQRASEVDLPGRAQELICNALELAHRALECKKSTYTPDGDTLEVVQHYALKGSTVNTLLKAIHDSGMQVDSYTASLMGSLIEKSFAVPEISAKLHSRQLALGILSMTRSESPVAQYEAIRILAGGLRAGFGFSKDLIVQVHAANQVVSAFDESGLRDLERLERIVFKPSASVLKSRTQLPQNGRPRSELKGGLGARPLSNKYILPGEIPYPSATNN